MEIRGLLKCSATGSHSFLECPHCVEAPSALSLPARFQKNKPIQPFKPGLNYFQESPWAYEEEGISILFELPKRCAYIPLSTKPGAEGI